MLRATLLAIACALSSACALSPQQVDIAPQPQVQTTNVGHNQPVQVTAVDSRDQQAFGTRGGVYKETALVRPGNNVKDAIEKAVRQGLQQEGFNAFNPGSDATRLEVRLEKLDYIPEQGSVVNEVTVKLDLRGEASRGDVSHTGTYKSSVVHDLPFTPTASQNQKMINDILGDGINRLLKDPKMQAFLAGNDNP
ncbi:MAG: YajG family lipoprotein [Alcanivorax sp.]|nr:YajG family lipoprotein [Alcanivorax sp.]